MKNEKDIGTRKFRVISADPPWKTGQTGARGANRHYALMSTAHIAAMPISDLAADHATLLLWVTSAGLQDGLDVMKAWGFSYRTTLVWDKRPALGLGNYFRNSHELLLHGVRGRAPFSFRGQSSVVSFPRMAHSVKPFEMAALIERVLPEGPYLELFARRRPTSRADWSIWGLEAPGGSDIELPGYPVPNQETERKVA